MGKGRGPCPPMTDRIIEALRTAAAPVTRGELGYMYGIKRPWRGESAATIQRGLELLEASGQVRRVRLPRRAYGPHCGDGWELVIVLPGEGSTLLR